MVKVQYKTTMDDGLQYSDLWILELKDDEILLGCDDNHIIEEIENSEKSVSMQHDIWYEIVLYRKERTDMFENPWYIDTVTKLP